MYFKLVTTIILLYGVSAISSFFDKGQRAEIFELTDNEVPKLKITLPEDEFAQMKETALYDSNNDYNEDINEYIKSVQQYFMEISVLLSIINYKEVFPELTIEELNSLFKGLNIDQYGIAHYNYQEINYNLYSNMNKEYFQNLDFKNIETPFYKYFFGNDNVGFDFYSIYSMVIRIPDEVRNKIIQNLVNNNNNDNDIINENETSSTSIYTWNNEETTENVIDEVNRETNSSNIDHENENLTLLKTILQVENITSSVEILKASNIPLNVNINQLQIDSKKVNSSLNSETTEQNEEQYITFKEFKTKNASMIVEINNEKKSFKKVTFSLGGKSSRSSSKLGYNIKIRGGDELYGRSQFKVRPDSTEATYMRSKLTCDIHNRLGLSSISANYVELYINEEYMGLYIMMDTYKPSWAGFEFDDKEATNLYQCACDLDISCLYCCQNENDEITDKTDLHSFLSTLNKAQTVEEIESVLDVDSYLKEVAIEYLIGSWDHDIFNNNNIYLYKPNNEKWKILLYDFDLEFGQNMETGYLGTFFTELPNQIKDFDLDFPNYSFERSITHHHILDVLILQDSTRFEQVLKEVVEKVFNPATLFPHIDEMKKFIRPYVIKDKTPDASGKYPGRINKVGDYEYTLEEWEANTEFTTIPSNWNSSGYGLKYWILARYRNVCRTYGMNCDPVYMDENYEYSVDKEVEFIDIYSKSKLRSNLSYPQTNSNSTDITNNTTTTTNVEATSTIEVTSTIDNVIPAFTTTEIPSSTEVSIPTTNLCWSESLGYACCDPENTNIYYHDDNGDWGYDFKNEKWCGIILDSGNNKTKYQCWAELIGYDCCDPKNTKIYDHDSNGDWGYDFKNNKWCGLTPYTEHSMEEGCWSNKFGYFCCKDCNVIVKDEDGAWGFDSIKDEWCGIPSYCPI